MTSGEKFGCDYLAYESAPGSDHSRFMVVCRANNDPLNCMDMLAVCRVAGQVGKHVLLAVVAPNSLIPSYVELNWWKGDA